MAHNKGFGRPGGGVPGVMARLGSIDRKLSKAYEAMPLGTPGAGLVAIARAELDILIDILLEGSSPMNHELKNED